MMEEKKSAMPASTPLYPFNLKDKDSTNYIAIFLSDIELIPLQRVNRQWRQAAIKSIQMRADEVKLAEVNEAERKNVLAIYQCLQSCKDTEGNPVGIPPNIPKTYDPYANLRGKSYLAELTSMARLTREEFRLLRDENLWHDPFDPAIHGHLQLPPLPAPPIDPWASLRSKRYMKELTYEEIHRLLKQDFLSTSLLKLGRSDCEKASLIMESPFLKRCLPKEELIRNYPSWFNRILGVLLLPPFCGFFATFFSVALLGFYTLAALLVGIVGIIVAVPACFTYIFCRNVNESPVGWLTITRGSFWLLFLPIYPIYCFFLAAYLGDKYGLSYACSSASDLVFAPWNSIKEVGESKKCRRLIDHILPQPYQTIADMAANADRVKRQAKASLNIEPKVALSVPSFSSEPTSQPVLEIDTTPLLGKKIETSTTDTYGSHITSPTTSP